MKASAPLFERSMVIIWSKPIAVGRAERADRLGRQAAPGRSRASKTTNSLPRPFILRKGIGAAAMADSGGNAGNCQAICARLYGGTAAGIAGSRAVPAMPTRPLAVA